MSERCEIAKALINAITALSCRRNKPFDTLNKLDARLQEITSQNNHISELERELAELKSTHMSVCGENCRLSAEVMDAEAREKALREALEEITHTSRDYAWKIAEEALAGKGE